MLRLKNKVVIVEHIERKIHFIRGQKVMLDKNLAELYQVRPIALRQQVKRNKDRFPEDFMFRLCQHEVNHLVSQNVIPSQSYLGGSLPYAFTEQGIAMLSSILKSKRAIYVNIAIMRAFIKLREVMATHKELGVKFKQLERKVGNHDIQIQTIFQAIRDLIAEPEKRKGPMGFVSQS